MVSSTAPESSWATVLHREASSIPLDGFSVPCYLNIQITAKRKSICSKSAVFCVKFALCYGKEDDDAANASM
jgi:hypothetical protein